MKILIKEFFKEDYISRVAGEKLRLLIVQAINKKDLLVLDFSELVIASTSFFDEGVAKLTEEKISVQDFFKYVEFKNLNKNDEKVLKKVTDYRGFILTNPAPHPWRVCPVGEHWVKEHPRLSKNKVETSVDGHCRKNPSGKDVIKAEELLEIASKHFSKVKDLPSNNDLGFPNGNMFNVVIAGWCTYWNEVLKTEIKINPDLVKALIATESGFEPEPKVSKTHRAIGIMQLMPETLNLLGPDGKELKDHFVDIDEKMARDPVVNIAAGIRWLFRKYELTRLKLKREPTWREVLYDYKGITGSKSAYSNRMRKILDKYLKETDL